jgi:acyl carrier protein
MRRIDTVHTIEAMAIEHLGADPARLQGSSPLVEAGLDSLAAIDLLFAIEAQFGVTIDATDLSRVHSLDDLAAIVDRLMADAGAPLS